MYSNLYISDRICKNIELMSSKPISEESLMMTGVYKLQNSSMQRQQSNRKVYYNSNTKTYLLLSREENANLETGIWMVGNLFWFVLMINASILKSTSFYIYLILFWFSLQITQNPRYNSYTNGYATIPDEILAVNLNCINYEDPTHDKCNDGWFFRKVDVKEFTKYPTLKLRCIGN